jgi:hypothetical protein
MQHAKLIACEAANIEQPSVPCKVATILEKGKYSSQGNMG